MNAKPACAKWLLSGAFAVGVQLASAGTMSVLWTDRAGDPGPVGDVLSAQLVFDSSGAWSATWEASTARPFTGNARFNLNLFDLALGDVNSATAPQVALDFVYDFGTSEATQFSYSGTTPFLANWHIGDQVASGNGSNFLSGAVDENPPYNRDNLMSVGTITGTVAEPESGGLVLLGIGLMGVVVCKKAERRLRAG